MIHHRLLLCIIFSTTISTSLISCDSQSLNKHETKQQTEAGSNLDHIANLQGNVTFTLEDGEVRNQENPDTFWIPPKERRENLVKDDLVKLIFNLSDGEQTQGERMWVIVTGGDRLGYTGILDNDPYSTDRIKAGFELSFEPRHVIDIFDDETPEKEETEEGVLSNEDEK